MTSLPAYLIWTKSPATSLLWAASLQPGQALHGDGYGQGARNGCQIHPSQGQPGERRAQTIFRPNLRQYQGPWQ
jgi:hypothetical protein